MGSLCSWVVCHLAWRRVVPLPTWTASGWSAPEDDMPLCGYCATTWACGADFAGIAKPDMPLARRRSARNGQCGGVLVPDSREITSARRVVPAVGVGHALHLPRPPDDRTAVSTAPNLEVDLVYLIQLHLLLATLT